MKPVEHHVQLNEVPRGHQRARPELGAGEQLHKRRRGQGLKLLEEKLLPGLIWDESELRRKDKIQGELMEELISMQVHPTNPARTTQIGVILPKEAQESFITFLWENVDIFAWSHEDMLGIDLRVIVHQLNVDPKHRPIKQK